MWQHLFRFTKFRFFQSFVSSIYIRIVVVALAKLFKQNIVTGCNCFNKDPTNIFNDPLYQEQVEMVIGFQIGQYVYAHKLGAKILLRALVIHINDDET